MVASVEYHGRARPPSHRPTLRARAFCTCLVRCSMFKKSGSCQSKSEAKLRGKELKALRAGLAAQLGLADADLDLILPTAKKREMARQHCIFTGTE